MSSTPRAAMMAVFASFGGAIGTLGGSIPSVMRAAGADNAQFGMSLTLATLATVLAMSLGGPIARIVSNRGMLLLALPLFALLMIAFLASRSAPWMFATYVPLGFMFGITDVFMNAEGAAIERDLKRPVFTGFHACASLGVALFAVTSSYVSVTYGPTASGLLLAFAFAIACAMVYRNTRPRELALGRAARIFSLPDKRPLVLLGLAAGLIIAGETAALLWSAKLLDELAPALAAIAGIGAAFFGMCNAMLRIPGDRLRARFGDLPLMIFSITAAIAGFAVLGLTGSFALSVAAFAAVGIGTAVLIPCILAMAAAHVPANAAGAIGFVSLLSGVPRILGPAAFGWVSMEAGIGTAFGMMAAALAVALAILVWLRFLR